MNEQLLISACMIFLGGLIGTSALAMIGSTFYDLRSISRTKKLRHAVNRLSKPRQPSLTVLLLAHNNSKSIEQCFRTLLKSTYKNYQIVIIDNASNDGTLQVIKRLNNEFHRVPTFCILKRKRSTNSAALLQGLRKSTASELIFVLRGDVIVSKSTLKQTVAHLNVQVGAEVVQLSSKITRTTSLFNFSNRLIQMSNHQFHKVMSLVSGGSTKPNITGTLYTSELFRLSHSGTSQSSIARNKFLYSSLTMETTTLSTSPISAKLAYLAAGVFQFCILLLITYAFFAAFTFRTTSLLALSWVTLVVWGLFVVLADDHSSRSEKLELCYGLPMTYILLYVLLILRMTTWVAWLARVIVMRIHVKLLRGLKLRFVR